MGFGLVLATIMAGLFYFTMVTMIEAAHVAQVLSMQQLVETCFGRVGKSFLNIALAFFAWGYLGSYTLILADEIPAVLNSKISIIIITNYVC